MTKKEYLHKRIEPEKYKKRLETFEQGRKCWEMYNFQKLLKDNEMSWEEHSSGYGRITHGPTGLYILMAVSPLTRTQHKCYNMDKLKEKVSSYLHKLEENNKPVNTLV